MLRWLTLREAAEMAKHFPSLQVRNSGSGYSPSLRKDIPKDLREVSSQVRSEGGGGRVAGAAVAAPRRTENS